MIYLTIFGHSRADTSQDKRIISLTHDRRHFIFDGFQIVFQHFGIRFLRATMSVKDSGIPAALSRMVLQLFLEYIELLKLLKAAGCFINSNFFYGSARTFQQAYVFLA